MPIYEYCCSNCGHKMEAIQKLSDAPLVSCPECKEDKLEKQLSPGLFVLKGEGFYNGV